MPTCPNCGATTQAGDAFCENCGAALPEGSRDQAPGGQQPPADRQPPQGGQPGGSRPTAPGRQPREGEQPPPESQQGTRGPQRPPGPGPGPEPGSGPGERGDPGGATGRRDLLKLGGVGVVLAGLGGGGWWLLNHDDEAPAAASNIATPTANRTPTDGRTGGGGGGGSTTPPEVDSYLAGADNYDGTVVDATGQDTVTIEVGAGSNGFGFNPAAIHVDRGTTVRWEWTGDGGGHDVVNEGGAFESDIYASPGVHLEHTFDVSDIYLYFCRPHRSLGQKGAIVVGQNYDTGEEPTPTATSRGDQEPVTVGAVLDLGDVLEIPGMRPGFDIAAEEIEEAGGLLGRGIDFTVQTPTSRDESVDAYRSVIEENPAGVIGPGLPGTALQIAEQAADSETPTLTVSNTPPISDSGTRDGVKYLGRTVPSDLQQAAAVGAGLDVAGAGTAAFLAPDFQLGHAAVQQARAAYESIGGEVTDAVFYEIGRSDFSTPIERVHEGDPEGIGFFGTPSAFSFFPQLERSGYGGELVVGEWLDGYPLPSEIRSTLEGRYIVAASGQDSPGVERFRDVAPGESVRFSAPAYDALFLLGLAIERAGETGGEAVARNLRAVSRPPGRTVTVGEFDRARQLLAQGTDVNYQGATGAVDLTERLEPVPPYDIDRFGADGSRTTVETIPASFFRQRM